MTAAVLPRPLRQRPANIAGMRGIQPGEPFGGYLIDANAFDVDRRPYVAGASREYTTASGVWEPTPTSFYLYVWGPEFGAVTLRDPSGALHELAPGWYPWPDENEPVQGALL